MLIKIAGYNIDADIIARIKELLEQLKENSALSDFSDLWAEDYFTPETLSAAYARISRSPEAVGELRKIARLSVSRARKSNQTIVFEMGHASVAEHAVFNIDISGVSRLAVETIEVRRLASFTEKSQRYIAMTREFIVPPELKGSPLQNKYTALCESLFDAYHQYLPVLEKYFTAQGAVSPELSAREDARYLLPLACGAQLGMTANARTLEHLIRRAHNHPLAEVQQFSQELHKAVEKIAPSLIRNIDLADLEIEREPETYKSAPPPESVKLMRATENADDVFLKALFATCEGVSYEEAESVISEMNITEKSKYLKAKLKGITEHHAFSRAYETVGFAFQLVVSASAYAQLKRHRITTQLPLPYHPDLGHTIPLSIIEAGLENDFREKMKSVERLYREIFPEFHNVAVYALTNAHRRVVYFYCNAREMYHLARLRMDSSAQWDIKTLVGKMVELAQENAPLTMALACGKDGFEEMKKAFLSKRP